MNKENPYVKHLERLRDTNDRGALATLRKGMSEVPGTSTDQYPYVVPWIPEESNAWKEQTYFLIGGLFALHPEGRGKGNMGSVFKKMRILTDSESVEKRFVAILNAHPEDFHIHLRHAISLAKSKDISIEWDQLFYDIIYWNHPQKFVQKQWAKAFWGNVSKKEE